MAHSEAQPAGPRAVLPLTSNVTTQLCFREQLFLADWIGVRIEGIESEVKLWRGFQGGAGG